MATDPNAPVTRGQYSKLVKFVKKEITRLDGLIEDAFTKINEVESHGIEMQDEAIDKADRAQRAVRRLKKKWDEIS